MIKLGLKSPKIMVLSQSLRKIPIIVTVTNFNINILTFMVKMYDKEENLGDKMSNIEKKEPDWDLLKMDCKSAQEYICHKLDLNKTPPVFENVMAGANHDGYDNSTILSLLARTEKQLLKIPDFGKKSLESTNKILENFGLELGQFSEHRDQILLTLDESKKIEPNWDLYGKNDKLSLHYSKIADKLKRIHHGADVNIITSPFNKAGENEVTVSLVIADVITDKLSTEFIQSALDSDEAKVRLQEALQKEANSILYEAALKNSDSNSSITLD